MACEICGMMGGHHIQCPHYSPPASHYCCSICDEPILNGEDYIVNDGWYAHWECVDNLGTRELLKWLDVTIQEMDGGNY